MEQLDNERMKKMIVLAEALRQVENERNAGKRGFTIEELDVMLQHVIQEGK